MKKIIPGILLNLFFISAFAQQRIVLVEQFTNSGCPPCATSTPVVLQYVDDNPSDVVAIAYHTSFPYNDSMYHENPAESNARVSFYGVPSVPYTIVDGNYYNNTSGSFTPVMATTINSRKAVASPYSVSALSNTITGNILNSKIWFASLSATNASDSLRAMIVVIEKEVQKSAYAASPGANTETVYKYVMRKMISGSAGMFLQNRNTGGIDSFNLSWNMLKIKDPTQVRVVSFVQNITTKEIYQSIMFSPAIVISVEEDSDLPSLKIYPNPATDLIYIESESAAEGKIELTDLSGRIIYSSNIQKETLQINTEQLAKGMYFINYSVGDKRSIRKLMIQ